VENAKVVLPYVSTIGVEAAALGKKVIMESDAYYAGYDFAPQAISRKDYYHQIIESMQLSNSAPLESSIEDSLIIYYFSQICNIIWTDFTPTSTGISQLIQKNAKDLLRDEIVQIVMNTMIEGIPAASQMHEMNLAKHRKT